MHPIRSYSPHEPQEAIWFEQSIMLGTFVGAIAYGMHVIIYFATIIHIYKNSRVSFLSTMFATVLFGLGTVNIASNIRFNEMIWILDRDYPGGPFAFIQQQEALATRTEDILGNSVTIIATCMADGLLLYRYFVVWNQRMQYLIIPGMLYLASITFSVLFILQVSQPNANGLWARTTFDFGVPYWALTMSLNIILTLMIVSRLFFLRRLAVTCIGSAHGKMYTNIAAIIIESALPYGLVSFIFIVLYAMRNTGENLFIPLLAQVQCISPELIVLQVARGHAWSKSTMAEPSLPEMQFTTHPMIDQAPEITHQC
ncbi:hypothetical protein WOLCODRAFT_83693 [Wolfiporia cocos MD-104 SS10]|uniref:Fungal pheromone STE3G-protein-coupled receptor n=1 Tax=Wolfiporia cocos (strain MD-104) TaxID=742152 RepID=A0A2H3JMG7_WOLCO|nr:hypothetical protein WOLCODRAFT_83693 [Wolfiporia cocos MD-104 SS10]